MLLRRCGLPSAVMIPCRRTGLFSKSYTGHAARVASSSLRASPSWYCPDIRLHRRIINAGADRTRSGAFAPCIVARPGACADIRTSDVRDVRALHLVLALPPVLITSSVWLFLSLHESCCVSAAGGMFQCRRSEAV